MDNLHILDSLIVWSDQDQSIDMALSFQESEGCQQVWDEIRKIQGRPADSKEVIQSILILFIFYCLENMEEEKENESDGDQDDGMDLPEPRSSTIKELLTTIQEVTWSNH